MAAGIQGLQCAKRATRYDVPSTGQQPRSGTPAGCRGIIGPVPPPTLDKKGRFLKCYVGKVSTGWSGVSRGKKERVYPKIGANFRISLAATKPRSVSVPVLDTGRVGTHSSPLASRLWAVGPSALPCAGAPPPQRPRSYNLPRRPGVDINDRWPIEGVSPDHCTHASLLLTLSSPLCLPCISPKVGKQYQPPPP